MTNRIMIGFLLISNCIALMAAPTTPLPAFHAEYQVLRNGKDLARTTLDLRQAGENWEFVTHTKGTSGLASLIGLDVLESSQFQWRNGLPQGLHYRYEQKASFSSRERQIDFDWTSNHANSKDGKHDWNLELTPGAMDRNLLVLALSADLKRNALTFAYPVAEKEKLENKNYGAPSHETVQVPAGELATLRVERKGGKSDKQTVSWHAPERGFLPVQLQQRESNGDTVIMRLIALEFH